MCKSHCGRVHRCVPKSTRYGSPHANTYPAFSSVVAREVWSSSKHRRYGASVRPVRLTEMDRSLPVRKHSLHLTSFSGMLLLCYLLFLFLQGPVASVFWLDEALESALRLDSIVTLVDAKNFLRQLQRVPEEGEGTGSPGDEQSTERPQNEAAMQVAYADRVLINKVGQHSRCYFCSRRREKMPSSDHDRERMVNCSMGVPYLSNARFQRATDETQAPIIIPQPSHPCSPFMLE